MNPKIHISKKPLTQARAVAETNKLIIEGLTSMAIHELKPVSETLRIQRVPGGWNYIYHDNNNVVGVSFVPLPKSLSMGY